MGFWASLLNSARSSSSRYEDQKRIAVSGSDSERRNLARRKSTNSEILCYMAAKDKNEDVRLILAKRLSDLLPGLSGDKHGTLYKYVVEALGMLALDEVLKIRVALSSALKEYADAPPQVVGKLARDIERQVSEPILKFCVALPDSDLLEILKSHPESWAIQAIAGRPSVSEPVSGAVIDTNDLAAGKILIENKGANLSTETFKKVVSQSRTRTDWQKPLAMRKDLTSGLAKELLEFVDQSVRDVLLNRTDFPEDISEELAIITSRRVHLADQKEHSGETTEQRVLKALKSGLMNDDLIGDAIAIRDHDFVIVALSAMCKTPLSNIRQIIDLKSAKSIVAICWKAGFSMRTALKIQQEIVKVPYQELIYPRGGTDYPLPKEDLLWQLDFLGIK